MPGNRNAKKTGTEVPVFSIEKVCRIETLYPAFAFS
jgi:hypothetical protein